MIYGGDNVLPWDCPEAIRLREETTRSAVSALLLYVSYEIRVLVHRTHEAHFDIWNIGVGDDPERIDHAIDNALDCVLSWHGIPAERKGGRSC